MSRLFPAGCLYITHGINDLIIQGTDITPYLNQHLHGDWGDICDDDKNANNHAVSSGGMILSAYQITPECKIWTLTDGGTTTIMLPCEY
ncbi:plasmid related protein [Salmonella enterica]